MCKPKPDSTPLDVVALGELLVDFAPRGTDPAGWPTLTAQPGGAPANFLAALSRCGARTALLGKVGADAFGDLLLNTLRTAGIDSRGVVQDPSVFTTLAFVTLSAQGDRSFSFARKPGADTMLRPEELQLSLLDRTKVFHFGSLSLTGQPVRAATEAAVARARDLGLLLTFDPNLRPPLWADLQEARVRMLWGCSNADVVKLSLEEAEFLFGLGPAEAADRLLQDYGVALALITLGPEGCLLKTPRSTCRVAPPPVEAVDTTGAGDLFFGFALGRILSTGRAPAQLTEADLVETARFATAAAALSTQRPGGIPSIPTLEEVRAAEPACQVL